MPKFSLALLLCAAAAFAAGQPWTAEDLWNRHTPSDPRISPDGQQVVYVEAWNDRTANASCSNLWWVSVRDKQPRRLTEGVWTDRSPRWSPDGTRIAWISGQGGIHVMVVASGEQTAIAAAPLSFAWSTDGRSIAFTAAVSANAGPPAWAPPAIVPWIVAQPAIHTGLFVVSTGGGAAEAITGADLDAAGEPAWMPDGKSILIATADGEIYSIRLAGRVARKLIADAGRKENPLPSPNGGKIAWMVTDSQPHSYSIRKLFVMNADGTKVKELANGLDRDPQHPQWSSDSRTIYFLADDAGSTHIFASRADSTLRQVTKGVERLRDFSLADNGHAVTVRSLQQSEEVVSFAVDLPPMPVVLASPMKETLAGRQFGEVEEIHVPSAGKSVQGWIVKPPQFDPARKYPLLLDIADAPRRMYGVEFDPRAQIYAAAGWMVLHVNPRGTAGYGEQFGRLLPTRYPGDDADDLLAAVDFVIAKGSVDPKRVAVSGGLLTAWLMGHSERFTAAVAHDAIVDFTPFAAGENRQILSWLGAMPWDDPDVYVHHSPLYFAGSWKTPTLVLAHGTDPQAEEFYAALQSRKVSAALLRVPGGERPANRILELQAVLAWLAQASDGARPGNVAAAH